MLRLGGFRAETMVMTSILTVLLLAVHGVGWLLMEGEGGGPNDRTARRRPVRLHLAGLFFLPFLAYAATNVVWVTPVRWLGWIDWFGWSQLVAVFWVVLHGIRSRPRQRVLLGVLLILAVIAVLCGCYQRFVKPDWLPLGRTQVDQYAGRASGCFGIPNSLAALLLLLLPFTGVLALRPRSTALQRVFFGWLTLVLLFGLLLTISRGAWIGFAIALVMWPLLAARRPWRYRAVLAAAVLSGVLLTGVTAYAGSARVRERFQQMVHDAGERSRPILWRAALKMFRAHPALGTGAGSFDVEFEAYRPEGFLNEPFWAHNDYLNTLSDYGAVGFVLWFGAVAATIVGCARTGAAQTAAVEPTNAESLRHHRGDVFDDPLVRQALAIGLLAFALQLFVDFHFKIPALAMVFATLAAVLVSRAWQSGFGAESSYRRMPGVLLALATTVFAMVLGIIAIPEYRGEALRQAARQRIDWAAKVEFSAVELRERFASSRGELERATAIAPDNAQAWADRSYVLAQWSRLEPAKTADLGVQAEAFANRAIELSAIWAEFWIRRGVARDMQGRWYEAGADLAKAAELSPASVLPWYHYAYHLSLRSAERGMADALVNYCLRLDPKNSDALSLRQRLATGRPGP